MTASPEVKALAKSIREDYGGAYVLTQAQVGKVIGKSKNTTRKWLEGLVPRQVGGGRPGYLVLDVAQKLLAP